jgi:LysM repeat protein
MLRIRIAFCACILFAGAAHAGIDNAGTTAGNFLSVGTGAGILSMGGATLGTGEDLNAAAWNPAALGRLTNLELALSHATLASQSTQDWLAAGGRFGHLSTRWGATALYQGEGSFDGRDAFGASTGSFNVSSMALGLQFAQPMGPVTAGLGAHWLSDKLGDVSGTGLGLDAGLRADAGAFGFGAAMRNVGGSMRYDAGTFDLPSVVGVGAAWSDARSGLRFALDANFPHAYYDDVRFGGEWLWQDRLALRAGYRLELGAAAGEPLGGPSFGLGAGVNGLWLDYAFLASGAAEQGQHRLGLTFHPGLGGHALRPVSDADASAAVAPLASAKPAPAPAKTAPAKSAPTKPAAAKAEPAAVAPGPSASPAPVAAAASSAPLPSNALASDVAPRPLPHPRVAKLAAGRPVPVTPLVLPPRAPAVGAVAARTSAKAAASKSAKSAPTAPASAPLAAAAPAPAPAAPATDQPAAPVPVADAPPSAPAPPLAQVADSHPRIVVVTRPADAAPAAEHVERPATVTVGAHETMADIARKWHTSVAAIMMENDLVKETVSKGQKLKLPRN